MSVVWWLLSSLFPGRRPQPPTPLPPSVAPPPGTGWRVIPGWEAPPDTVEIRPLKPEPKPRNTRWKEQP